MYELALRRPPVRQTQICAQTRVAADRASTRIDPSSSSKSTVDDDTLQGVENSGEARVSFLPNGSALCHSTQG